MKQSRGNNQDGKYELIRAESMSIISAPIEECVQEIKILKVRGQRESKKLDEVAEEVKSIMTLSSNGVESGY